MIYFCGYIYPTVLYAGMKLEIKQEFYSCLLFVLFLCIVTLVLSIQKVKFQIKWVCAHCQLFRENFGIRLH
jgi:hypothetical protein